jgi:glyoxylase I family protein
MIGVTGVQHVALEVSDLEAARRFYVDLLGFRVLERPDFGFPGLWLGLPDGRAVHLIEGRGEAHHSHHFALQVDDVDAAVVALRQAGVEVRDARESAPGSGRQTFLTDPSGNLIELNQPTTS